MDAIGRLDSIGLDASADSQNLSQNGVSGMLPKRIVKRAAGVASRRRAARAVRNPQPKHCKPVNRRVIEHAEGIPAPLGIPSLHSVHSYVVLRTSL